METFTTVLKKDKAIVDLIRDDVITVRKFLQERIIAGEITVHTGNKCLGRVAGMWRVVVDDK